MKLDRECVRNLLLTIEDARFNTTLNLDELSKIDKMAQFTSEQIIYTIEKLIEANFIVGKVTYAGDEPYFVMVNSLTWSGHQFLDNIRDDGVWTKTKKITSQFSSVSISMLSSVASSVISSLINKNLGN